MAISLIKNTDLKGNVIYFPSFFQLIREPILWFYHYIKTSDDVIRTKGVIPQIYRVSFHSGFLTKTHGDNLLFIMESLNSNIYQPD